jgi:hypothetical protein
MWATLIVACALALAALAAASRWKARYEFAIVAAAFQQSKHAEEQKNHDETRRQLDEARDSRPLSVSYTPLEVHHHSPTLVSECPPDDNGSSGLAATAHNYGVDGRVARFQELRQLKRDLAAVLITLGHPEGAPEFGHVDLGPGAYDLVDSGHYDVTLERSVEVREGKPWVQLTATAEPKVTKKAVS